MHRILVTGATGNVGGLVLSQLATTDAKIRALVRNPEAGRFGPQVEVVQGDLTRPETLDACLDGIDSVFLVWTAPPATTGAVLARIAKRARRIVFLSAPLKTPHPFFQQPNPMRVMGEQIEQQIESSGLSWTFLRPGIFAGNASRWWAPQIRAQSVLRWPYLNAPTAPIDERDIAEVAVRVLCEEGHAEAEYVLTGPQSLTQRDQISAIGDAIGQSLAVEETSPEQAQRELGLPNFLLDAWAAAIGQPAFVTSTVEEITGKPARKFRDRANDHALEFRA
jgi:uncharacterized protein YbjT (DUF2867 family)